MSIWTTKLPTRAQPRAGSLCPTTWGIAIPLTALALLLGSVSARGFDEPAAQPAPSLDDELLKDLESDLESGLGEDEALEYCRLSFAAEGSEGRPDISVVIPSDLAESIVVGGADGTNAAEVDVEREVLAHLAQMMVTATAQLGHTHVTLRDLLCLAPGDVLLIDTRVGEPIPLQVDGRAVMSGLPAQSSGKYALMITARPAGSTAGASNAPA